MGKLNHFSLDADRSRSTQAIFFKIPFICSHSLSTYLFLLFFFLILLHFVPPKCRKRWLTPSLLFYHWPPWFLASCFGSLKWHNPTVVSKQIASCQLTQEISMLWLKMKSTCVCSFWKIKLEFPGCRNIHSMVPTTWMNPNEALFAWKYVWTPGPTYCSLSCWVMHFELEDLSYSYSFWEEVTITHIVQLKLSCFMFNVMVES